MEETGTKKVVRYEVAQAAVREVEAMYRRELERALTENARLKAQLKERD